MTRDLPLDDAAGADDNGGDAAYHIANGVARVARAGAYVTGGALIAAGGSRGGTPAITHDSKQVGWSQVNDPQPEAPSPTKAFPDLTPDSMPPQHHAPVALVNTPFHRLDGFDHGLERGTDAGLFPTSFDSVPQNPAALSGFQGLGLPDSDPGVGGPPGYGQHPAWMPEQLGQSETVTAQPHLPAAELPEPNFLQHLPGFGLPGTGGMHVPGMTNGSFVPGADVGHQPGAFDGIGGIGHTDGQGVGAFVGTNWTVDAHIGLDGIWFRSDLKVDVGLGDVGHQLDAFNQQVSNSLSHGGPAYANQPNAGANGVPGASANPGQSANTPGSATPAAANSLPAHGASDAPAGATPTSAVPGSNSPTGTPLTSSTAPASTAPVGGLGAPSPVAAQPAAPVLGTPAPSAPAAPVTFTPAPAPAPVAAPVVPAPTAPVVVAPVPVAQPVAVTPLQTTIQPDAANQPIANLLSTHGGPSPLTAPAAVAAPALYDHGKQPVPAGGEPSAPGHPATLVDKPVTAAPAPAPHLSAPATIEPAPVLTTVPPVPTIKVPNPDTEITKPGTAVTTPVTPPANPGGKDDITTKPHTPADEPGGHGSTPTVPTDDAVPTHVPTAPTTQPQVSVAPAPTVAPEPVHTPQPTVSVAPAPTVAPVPTVQAPITTPAHIEPVPVKPIADHYDSGALPIADDFGLHPMSVHDGGLLVHDAGLFSGLTPDASFVDAHHTPAPDPGNHMLLL
ncbi:hypothetical protein [Nocardia seriolae]|uniref:hypothetical protein n=1 Tax=Nocardia seriolae TaxID=37332 RepID=UPI000519EEF5|nr:hypothetical protein [Nocardia seriolae]MTJ65331.1 hypothetical protein [Nocardia seriolae]MTJ71902.1 hypothetical protein [Nocardia seriolae]MTJ90217.1 hypothetical protein [Nocardia seriolae]RLP32499.1 hypothetical protein D6158_07475 [Nocardia seriolae]WKY54223.1 hypothetical protein Q5P07_09295 [Nocardia seriolae]